MEKRVYIAYTGGTIGMRPTASGYAPAAGYLNEQLAAMPEFRHAMMPDFDIHEYTPLLDSANMTPIHWHNIALDIAEHYADYDGFIVLHGTDTMAYTASALPFMLQGLNKPIIITGSQIPLCEVRNDARDNLITALMIAANYRIPEVCLYFGDRLLRGCRTTKVSADGFQAFASPNYPSLGEVGIDIEIDWEEVRPVSSNNRPIEVVPFQDCDIGVLRLFPGISANMVERLLQEPLQGLIIEAYGVGNGPQDAAFINTLQQATQRGVVIVDCSQCLDGTVNLTDYAAGSALAQAGVISGFDMTTEAALAKLFYLFSQNLTTDEIKAKMQTNLVGELTQPQS